MQCSILGNINNKFNILNLKYFIFIISYHANHFLSIKQDAKFTSKIIFMVKIGVYVLYVKYITFHSVYKPLSLLSQYKVIDEIIAN